MLIFYAPDNSFKYTLAAYLYSVLNNVTQDPVIEKAPVHWHLIATELKNKQLVCFDCQPSINLNSESFYSVEGSCLKSVWERFKQNEVVPEVVEFMKNQYKVEENEEEFLVLYSLENSPSVIKSFIMSSLELKVPLKKNQVFKPVRKADWNRA